MRDHPAAPRSSHQRPKTSNTLRRMLATQGSDPEYLCHSLFLQHGNLVILVADEQIGPAAACAIRTQQCERGRHTRIRHTRIRHTRIYYTCRRGRKVHVSPATILRCPLYVSDCAFHAFLAEILTRKYLTQCTAGVSTAAGWNCSESWQIEARLMQAQSPHT